MRGKGLPRPSEQHGRSYGPCHVISARGTLCARRGLTGHLGFLCAVRHPAPALLYEIEVNCCCPRRMVTRSEPWIATCAGALCVPADFCFSKRPALSPNLGRPSLPECTPFFSSWLVPHVAVPFPAAPANLGVGVALRMRTRANPRCCCHVVP